MTTQDELDLLVRGEHCAPHDLLGAHPDGAGAVVVRAFKPLAESVVVVVDGDTRTDLVHRHEATGPNAVWQADHTELDIRLRDGRGRPEKPWLTVILDAYSRAVAGYALFLGSPSAIQTALALHQAIWRKGRPGWQVCGIPGILYSDHGSDFTSRHLEQVAAGDRPDVGGGAGQGHVTAASGRGRRAARRRAG